MFSFNMNGLMWSGIASTFVSLQVKSCNTLKDRILMHNIRLKPEPRAPALIIIRTREIKVARNSRKLEKGRVNSNILKGPLEP